MTTARRIRTLHRWLSVVIGLQLLAWAVSGFVFTWEPIGVIRGEAFLIEPEVPVLDAPRASPAEGALPAGTHGLELTWVRGDWHWRAADAEGETLALFLPGGAEALPELTAEEAHAAAAPVYAWPEGPGELVEATLLRETVHEYGGRPLPAWRLDYDDGYGSSLYVDAHTGQVTLARNDAWRRFDWFWMLHIMDYDERSDFSHPLLQGAALLGVTTAITGLWLAVLVFRARARARARGGAGAS